MGNNLEDITAVSTFVFLESLSHLGLIELIAVLFSSEHEVHYANGKEEAMLAGG